MSDHESSLQIHDPVDPLTGTIIGNRIRFTRNATGQGFNQPCDQVFEGLIEDNTARGTFTTNGAPAGSWSFTQTGMTSGPTPPGPPPPLVEVTVFDSMNIYGVANQPTAPATFNIRRPHVITSIMTYHWNDGRGTRVGTIALRDANGRTYGPWPVIGTPGQGGVPNVAWTCNPNVEVPAGTYTIVDSEPVTWSQNPQSGGRGMAVVTGYPIDSTETQTTPSVYSKNLRTTDSPMSFDTTTVDERECLTGTVLR